MYQIPGGLPRDPQFDRLVYLRIAGTILGSSFFILVYLVSHSVSDAIIGFGSVAAALFMASQFLILTRRSKRSRRVYDLWNIMMGFSIYSIAVLLITYAAIR